MNIQLLTCVVLVADDVKLGGSFSDLQSQQGGLKRWDSEVKPKENQKEMQHKHFWEGGCMWGECRSDFALPHVRDVWS